MIFKVLFLFFIIFVLVVLIKLSEKYKRRENKKPVPHPRDINPAVDNFLLPDEALKIENLNHSVTDTSHFDGFDGGHSGGHGASGGW